MTEAERLLQLKLVSSDEASERKKRAKTVKRLAADVKSGSYAEKLHQAGLSIPVYVWVGGVSFVSLFFGVFLFNLVGGLVGIVLGPSFCIYFLTTYLTARAEKRRRAGVPHLPGLIDTLSASLQTGYSMDVAVEHAAASLPEGVLKTELLKSIDMNRKGMELEEALELICRRISGQEIISLVITIKLFSDMGGRGLAPFKRLGVKLREQQSVLERASRDLVGTKQAFYVIFGLSLTAPLFLMVSEPEYLKAAFEHSWIRYVMQGAIVVQMLCFVFFKRFTTLKV